MSSTHQSGAKAQLVGIHSLIYGVEDMDLCHRFFDDWGLRTCKRDTDEAIFETRQGPQVVLRNVNKADFFFPASLPGPSMREVVWGVESKEDLDLIGEQLSKRHKVIKAKDGSVHSVDPYGYGIGFRVWAHAAVEATHNWDAASTKTNFIGSRQRISEPGTH